MARGLSPGLRHRLTPYGVHLLAAAGVSSVVALVPAGVVALVGPAVAAMEAGDVRSASTAGVALLALAALGVALRLLRTALTKHVAWQVAAALRLQLVATWLRDPRPFDVGDGLAALTDECDQVQYGVSAMVTLLRDPLTLMALVASALWVAPQLVPLLLVGVPLVGLAGWGTGRWVARATARQRDARSAWASRAGEVLLGRSMVRAFGATERELAGLRATADADARARLRMDTVRQLPSAATELLAYGAVALLLVRGAALVANGSLAPGGLVAFVAALLLAQRPLARLSEAWSLLRRAEAALARVEAVLAAAPTPPRAEGRRLRGPARVQILGAEAWGDDGACLLGPVDLEIPPGQFVAVVGATGAGKSTLLSLVAGARAPDRGEVRVDGEALAAWADGERAAAVAVVPQDGFVFARSLLANLRLGAPQLSEAEATEALVQARAGFLAQGPEGLGRGLGPAGAPLSGGERQRLALARALAVKAPLLVLDEPTNQVDAATELALVEALQALGDGVTRVVACHDLAVAEAADRVLVVERGQVVEDGPPRVLRAAQGRYARLAGAS